MPRARIHLKRDHHEQDLHSKMNSQIEKLQQASEQQSTVLDEFERTLPLYEAGELERQRKQREWEAAHPRRFSYVNNAPRNDPDFSLEDRKVPREPEPEPYTGPIKPVRIDQPTVVTLEVQS
jgi:hypothetical protein